jgi:putative oxygen-independent coproporphyrinogen III oxidase
VGPPRLLGARGARAPRANDQENAVDLSVYVHFPWCLRKCPYCDFATSPLARADIPHEGYADAVVAELSARAAALPEARLYSVFFGGGTPSLWEPRELGRVLAAIRAAFGAQAPDLEITVECNPSSLDAARAEALAAAGVNRFSIGVQSLDNAELQFLGRLHDRSSALAAVDAALATGLRTSADLIFALPQQPDERLFDHVDTLLARGLSHVSAYALTIEPSTPFGASYRKGLLKPAPDEAHARMFLALRERFAAHGLAHYEVSNYARPGEESRHNVHYWRAGSYLGLGAAAVGCLPHAAGHTRRYRNHPDAKRYGERAATPAQAEVFDEELDAEAQIREALMLGLRTREGVDLGAVGARLGVDPWAPRKAALARRIQSGDVVREGGVLRVPKERWLFLDGIVADLF